MHGPIFSVEIAINIYWRVVDLSCWD